MINILFLESSKDFGGQEMRMVALVKRMDKRRFKLTVGAPRSSYLYKHQKQLGIKVTPVSMFSTFDIFGLIKIIGLILFHQIKIVVTYSGKDAWLGLIAGKLCRCKVVRMKNLELFHHKTSYNFSDVVVVPSIYIKQFLVERGVHAKKIKIIYPGIDTETIQFNAQARQTIRERYHIQSHEILIIYIAFFRRPKSQKVLIGGLHYLTMQNVKLMLVGDGDEEYIDEIKKLLVDYNLENRVILTGRQEDTVAFLSAADIFVFPSLTEAFSRSIIEAMACGLPIVANDIPTVREALDNGKRGYIYGYDTPVDMVTKLRRCIEEYPGAKRKAQQNISYIKEHFSIESMVQEFEALFSSILQPQKHVTRQLDNL